MKYISYFFSLTFLRGEGGVVVVVVLFINFDVWAPGFLKPRKSKLIVYVISNKTIVYMEFLFEAKFACLRSFQLDSIGNTCHEKPR